MNASKSSRTSLSIASGKLLLPEMTGKGGAGEPHWYAIYTRANHERSVSLQLEQRGVEHYLPQYESVRQWKDRKIRLQLPLFPGYVFGRFSLHDRLGVLQVPGVANLVTCAGRPIPVPEEEFRRVREVLSRGLRAEPHRYLTVGQRVRVTAGPLEGLSGIIVRRKNSTRFVVSLDLIQRSIAVDIAGSELQVVAAAMACR